MARGTHPGVRADRLLRARFERGLTGDELAELSGCSSSAIYNYETGKQLPSARALHRLAEALGRDVAWFLPEEGDA